MRALFVSYDGIAEPLGRSQVLAYLRRLARDCDSTLISFEKERPTSELVAEISGAGITWFPRRYHRNPPLASTLADVISGVAAIRSAATAASFDVLHARSYVPALMVQLARSAGVDGRLLFDIRGFWRDERIDGGFWRRGSVIDRVVQRCEKRFFADADAVVTLTHASVSQIQRRVNPDVPITVIPTCVEVDRFSGEASRPGPGRLVWSGSVGPWYRLDLAAGLARAAGERLTVLTRQTEEARMALGDQEADVRSVPSQRMGGELRPGDIGLCLIRPSFSKIASAPTRFAEFMAAGMPVAVTPRVGDLEALVEGHQVGLVIRSEAPADLRNYVRRLHEMASDESVRERCRALAREMFDADTGAAQYLSLYRSLSR